MDSNTLETLNELEDENFLKVRFGFYKLQYLRSL